MGCDDEDDHFAPAAFLQAPTSTPEEELAESDWREQSTSMMRSALTTLDERSRNIIVQRWLNEDKSTLQELADEYGVSAERVRQLEQNALKKMRGRITL